jgi:hypothetical protein
MRFGTALQRALVEPIGLRAFERGFEPSLLEAFACPLDCSNGGLKHLGDLSVAERLSLGVIAYDVGFEQDAGSVQLTRWGAARRDELVQVNSLLFAELDEVFLFHSSSPPKTDRSQDKPLDTNVKSSLTED